MSTSLNPQQLEAVRITDRPLLVIAGAGSGKTRVITEKVVHLIRQGLPARHIAAVTFTNKAAREMKTRVGNLTQGKEARGLTVSTFHALGLEILRREHKSAGFRTALSLFDEHDRATQLRELIRHGTEGLDPERAGAFAQRISLWKNLFLTPERALAEAADDAEACQAARLYAAYARQMRAFNAVDFDDLILEPVLLFQRDAAALERWRQRIRYLLVDEYQDTNQTQYELVRLLAGRLGQFTVVGDDDQSVYAWRGAQPENLARLARDYPRLEVVKLEQNYRSSGRILKAANRLIANNPHVFTKALWSAHGPGEPLRVLRHADDVAEAQQIVADLAHHRFRHGGAWGDYAILYRNNYQSRPLEKALREQGVPYFISGGASLFSHAEVKDVLGYLRLLVNPDDDAAFLRVVNTPAREIGPVTLEKLGTWARARRISLFEACFELGLEQTLPPQAVQRLRHFGEHLTDVADRASRGDTLGVIEEFLTQIRYREWLEEHSDTPAQAERRLGRVAEVIGWIGRLLQEDDTPTLDAVLARLMLLDILERGEEEKFGDRVSLMTLHAAKGLEFPSVYLAGMEEGLLPHEARIDAEDVEEERRLAYVGITRARRQLTLSYCARRRRFGGTVDSEPSRFLDELPPEDLEWPQRHPIDPATRKARGQETLTRLRDLLSTGQTG